jgi:hypothetical protein
MFRNLTAFLWLKSRARLDPVPDEQAAEGRTMTAYGVRREKAALSSGCEAHPAIRSSRKQSEQSWRQRNG